ncbi:hypothetical protein [Pseudoduganella albidiflava]|uniref:Uncharacterized protein n=1 Tax=Pseudoduganella albidiflava TaxID=321983 RepID=A0A411WYH6_9BURK|nr:hypothetical protein [Pseudoduganella albidiflava]QBI01750.1 hypothetical protein EYF70_13485 [Pseudoduganella albidiflava]GGY39987.1 hypothetical protein GCM10007387_22670 [Pseudoduganella albidiflava]
MATDREIALQVQRLQDSGRDVPLMQLPGYMEWSKRKLNEGVSEALIAHLDGLAMFLLPEDDQTVGIDEYEELLEDLIEQCGE